MAHYTPAGAIIPALPGTEAYTPARVPLPMTPQPGMGMLPPQNAYFGQQPMMMQSAYAQPAYGNPYGQPAYAAPTPYLGAGNPGGGGGMIIPVGGGSNMFGMGPPTRERLKQKEENPPLDKWLAGTEYGPILETAFLTILGAEIQIHPLLRHFAENADDARLSWDVLLSMKNAEVFDGDKYQQWTEGRDATATIPRMSSLTLVSTHFPWGIVVRASGKNKAVTCLDVVSAIQEFMQEKVPTVDYQRLSKVKRRKIDTMYHHNRSSDSKSPGNTMKPGVRKGDWVAEYTLFDGIEDDPDAVRELCGMGKIEEEAQSTPARGKKPNPKAPPKLKRRPLVGMLYLHLAHRYDGADVEVPPPPPEEEKSDGRESEEEEPEILPGVQIKGKKKGKQGQQMGGMPMMPGMQPGMQPGMMYNPMQGMQGMQPMLMPMQQQFAAVPGMPPQYMTMNSPIMPGYGLPQFPSLGTPHMGGHHGYQ